MAGPNLLIQLLRISFWLLLAATWMNLTDTRLSQVSQTQNSSMPLHEVLEQAMLTDGRRNQGSTYSQWHSGE